MPVMLYLPTAESTVGKGIGEAVYSVGKTIRDGIGSTVNSAVRRFS